MGVPAADDDFAVVDEDPPLEESVLLDFKLPAAGRTLPDPGREIRPL